MRTIKAYLIDQSSEVQNGLERALGEMEKVNGYPIGLVYYKEYGGKELRHTSFVVLQTKEEAGLIVDLINAKPPTA